MLKSWGDTQSLEVVLTWELEVLAILKGDAKNFSPFKRGAQKVLHCLEGGGAPANFTFCSPRPPHN